jgi:hypothetical protein
VNLLEHKPWCDLVPAFGPASVAACGLALLFGASSAAARKGGIVSAGCQGCHNGGQSTNVTIAMNPATFDPGAAVTVSVSIQALNGNTAGMYLLSNSGVFSVISGQPTTRVSDTEVTHNAPKTATGGFVTFDVRWTAPSTPGGVALQVWALSANANGSASGDGEGTATFTKAFGCATGITYYTDFDHDGHGTKNFSTMESCAKPEGFADNFDDCDDNDEKVHPGAPERCNMRDDNCDGQIDDGLTGSVLVYPDKDGDGYGTAAGGSVMVSGCAAMPGYVPIPGDCSDSDPAIYPMATEICNGRDDNCDGRIDEGVRPICGVGACRRYARTCMSSDCSPGLPMPEVCNSLDDDCNGIVDDVPGGCGGGTSSGGATGVGTGGASGGAGVAGSSTSHAGTTSGAGGASATGGAPSSATGGAPPASGTPPMGGSTLGGGEPDPTGQITPAPANDKSSAACALAFGPSPQSPKRAWLALLLLGACGRLAHHRRRLRAR